MLNIFGILVFFDESLSFKRLHLSGLLDSFYSNEINPLNLTGVGVQGKKVQIATNIIRTKIFLKFNLFTI